MGLQELCIKNKAHFITLPLVILLQNMVSVPFNIQTPNVHQLLHAVSSLTLIHDHLAAWIFPPSLKCITLNALKSVESEKKSDITRLELCGGCGRNF